MALERSNPLTTAAIRVAAAGLGVAVEGPLGCALGAVIGNALGPSAAELIGTYIQKFGDEAAKKLLDTGANSLLEKLKPSAPNLEFAYREAMRVSLSQMRPQITALIGHESMTGLPTGTRASKRPFPSASMKSAPPNLPRKISMISFAKPWHDSTPKERPYGSIVNR